MQAPDILQIIEDAAPGQDGVSIMYSLAGGLSYRVATLAGKVTNLLAGYVKESGIDGYNNCIAALDEVEARNNALREAGCENSDMLADLRALVAYYNEVAFRITALTKKKFSTDWPATIKRAAEPRQVEEWKLADGWQEYLEACHGKPEMTEAEHREMETLELSGKRQTWADHVPQVVATIEAYGDITIDFDELSLRTQNSILATLSTDEKQETMRINAKKMAKSRAELHGKRMMINDFVVRTREALTHSRYACLQD